MSILRLVRFESFKFLGLGKREVLDLTAFGFNSLGFQFFRASDLPVLDFVLFWELSVLGVVSFLNLWVAVWGKILGSLMLGFVNPGICQMESELSLFDLNLKKIIFDRSWRP